jgi:hypothetical protein
VISTSAIVILKMGELRFTVSSYPASCLGPVFGEIGPCARRIGDLCEPVVETGPISGLSAFFP